MRNLIKLWALSIMSLLVGCEMIDSWSDGSSSTSGDDRVALMALYNSTDGDNWYDNTNWGSSADISEWYGVQAGTKASSSISVDLSNNNLQGAAIISETENITSLELSNNSISSVEIDNTKLATISMSGNAIASIIYNEVLPTNTYYDVWSVGDLIYPLLVMIGGDTTDAWGGNISTPAINVDSKTITVRCGAELGWVAQMCNSRDNEYDQFEDWTIYQSNNLDLSGAEWVPIGLEYAFKGTYDGQNKQITNLYINTDEYKYAALFGDCEDAVIKNVIIQSGSVNNEAYESYSAGICACGNDTRINDCINNAYVKGTTYSGGIVGFLDEGEIYSCSNIGGIDCFGIVGGIVGYSSNVNISLCTNSGGIYAYDIIAIDYLYAGGICGSLYDSKGCAIQGCVNTGMIVSTCIFDQGDSCAGGIVGYARGYIPLLGGGSKCITISACENRGNVSVDAFFYASAGGIVGYGYANILLCVSDCDYISANSWKPEHDLELIGLTPHARAGGIRGVQTWDYIATSCYSSGSIRATAAAQIEVDDALAPCSSAGSIEGTMDTAAYGNTWNPLSQLTGTFLYDLTITEYL